MLFKEIPGHKLIKEQLIRSSAEARVSHALLLHGPEGNAGFALALAFSQYLNCTGEKKDDACGVCPSCQKAAKLIHPDIHYIFPVATTKKIKSDPVSDHFLEEWRSFISEFPYPGLSAWMNFLDIENKQGGIFKNEAEALLRKMSLKAFESEYKVVIVWLPEKMNASTANKLLKIIEEPPDNTVFLMVAEQPQSLLPTILSRTQLLQIPKFSDEELLEGLRSFFPERVSAFSEYVSLADGNILAASYLLNSDEQVKYNQQQFIDWMRMCYNYKVQDILDWIPGIAAIGRERQKSLLMYVLHTIRENFLQSNNLGNLVRMTESEREFSSRFHRFIHTENIEALSQIISRAIRQIEMNANPRILFLDVSYELYRALRIKKPA